MSKPFKQDSLSSGALPGKGSSGRISSGRIGNADKDGEGHIWIPLEMRPEASCARENRCRGGERRKPVGGIADERLGIGRIILNKHLSSCPGRDREVWPGNGGKREIDGRVNGGARSAGRR